MNLGYHIRRVSEPDRGQCGMPLTKASQGQQETFQWISSDDLLMPGLSGKLGICKYLSRSFTGGGCEQFNENVELKDFIQSQFIFSEIGQILAR